MIAAGQQRRPGRRAHGRRMKPVVGNSFLDDPVHRRGLHLAAERRRKPWACVVDKHDQDVRRVGRKPARRHPLFVDRLLHRSAGDAGRGRGWEWKGLLLFRFVLGVSHPSPPRVCEQRPRRSISAPPAVKIASFTCRDVAAGHWRRKRETRLPTGTLPPTRTLPAFRPLETVATRSATDRARGPKADLPYPSVKVRWRVRSGIRVRGLCEQSAGHAVVVASWSRLGRRCSIGLLCVPVNGGLLAASLK